MTEMRIQKLLSQQGIASRREVERMILEGRISLNGKTLHSLGVKVDPANAHIMVDGRALTKVQAPKVYWMFHKAANTLCVRAKPDDNRASIYDAESLNKLPFFVSAAGRLDYKGEGLLLLSNDETFVSAYSNPKLSYPRHYAVLATGKLSEEALQQIQRGVPLEDGPAKGIEVSYAHGKNLGASRGSWYFVTTHSSRHRLIQRVFERFDQRVIKLVRYGLGDFRMPEELSFGEHRQLTVEELSYLRKLVGLSS